MLFIKLLRTRTIITVLFLFMSAYSKGQMKIYEINWNLHDTTRMIYDKYILPPLNNGNTEVAAFWLNPIDQPEYSLRIIKSTDNRYYLEGMFLSQRIDKSLDVLIQDPKARLSIDVNRVTISISENFKQKIQSSFNKTMNCQEKVIENPNEIRIFDGVCYKIRFIDGNNELVQSNVCDLKKSDSCYEIIMTYLQIAADLREQTFDELKYPDRLK